MNRQGWYVAWNLQYLHSFALLRTLGIVNQPLQIQPRPIAHALPCESCGKPVEERKPATWDSTLMVGPCCEFDPAGIPDMPTCEGLYRAIMRCTTVRQVEQSFTAHRLVCPFCRREPAPEMKGNYIHGYI